MIILLWGLLTAQLMLGPSQILDTKDMPENKGSISQENTYTNPTLGLTLVLPGAWHFFDRTMYTTPQQKQEEEEAEKKALANCQGPLCGHGEIDVALQSPMTQPPKMAVYLTAYKLSAEYQNRERHPLRKFAVIMGVGSMGPNWVSEGELTAVQLGGKPAYRLIVHNKETATARGFLYVADSNGRVFMLLAVAMSDPEKLQMAVEHLKFASPGN
jgi:hypothetical protein